MLFLVQYTRYDSIRTCVLVQIIISKNIKRIPKKQIASLPIYYSYAVMCLRTCNSTASFIFFSHSYSDLLNVVIFSDYSFFITFFFSNTEVYTLPPFQLSCWDLISPILTKKYNVSSLLLLLLSPVWEMPC